MSGWSGWSRLIILAAATVCVAGCLQVDVSLNVEPDGSGRVRLMYAMKRQALAQVQTMQALAAELERAGTPGTRPQTEEVEIPLIFDEAKIRQRFRDYERAGVKLQSVTVRTRQEWQAVDVRASFDKLEELVRLPFLRDCAFALKKRSDGHYHLSIQGPPLGIGGGDVNLADSASLGELAPLLAGLAVRVRVDVPGDILRTDASFSDARGATWEFDFDKEPRSFERFAAGAPQPLQVVFSGTGLFLKEFEKPAQATGAPAGK